MSLIDYLASSLPETSTINPQVTQALQAASTKTSGNASGTAGVTGIASDLLITVTAKRKAAASADADKDAAALATDLRASLDTQYAAAGKGDSADLTVLSGRALAIMAQGGQGGFSRTEAAAAKQELRERDRQAAVEAMSSAPLTAASLRTFTQTLLAERDAMSAEERALREADPSLR